MTAAGIRILHASTELGEFDVYVNDNLCIKTLPFTAITQYIQLPAGDNWVEVFRTGDPSKAIHRRMISVRANRCYTVCLQPKKIFVVEDSHLSQNRSSGPYLRFIHLLQSGPNMDLINLSGSCFFSNNGYMGVSPYRAVSPQTTNFSLRVSGTRKILFHSPIYRLEPSRVYTVYVLGVSPNAVPYVLIVPDRDSHILY
ncbi:DUF4397 domain-containing protein [Shimazuella kribbensis]|uniref:DUF4397 domain-containing protein n=1 Tax=Shimazuella kribbensis TaxID=139808 RepID=UPI000407700F|nr:DUF4397 domain-containing protein [Shimazuella kribbensis]